ncbi:MAG: response regulator, partial [Peptococcaceae bacterium]|nr:response regulator [Peptococcaceae bacterium]
MRNLLSLFREYIFDEDLPLSARQINVIYLVGISTAVVVMLCTLFSSADPRLTLIILLITVFASAIFVLNNWTKRYGLLTKLTVIVLAGLLFPGAFFFMGGRESGMPAYFALCIVIIFFLTKGKETWFFVIGHVAIVLYCYYLGYIHPDWVSPLTLWTQHFNQVVALVATGICISMMLRFQSRLYDFAMQQLRQAREEATQASVAKSSFLSNMSHEIRTPLNAIVGMASLIKQAEDNQRKDYCAQQIIVASAHLLGVINDILDVAKIEAGKLELTSVDYAFEAMIHRVISIIAPKMEEKGLRFSREIDVRIPRWLTGDDQRLAQVLLNLLNNAVKFTPKGGEIHLIVDLLREEDGMWMLKFMVQDSGIGISAEQQKKLFQAFTQAESDIARKYGGTGLGLAISKNIVEMMEGNIWVESDLGQGSVFAFTVQMKTSFRKTHGVQEIAAEWMTPMDDFSSYTLLLAEDVEINREIVAALLEPTGMRIVCAENGVEAVQLFTAAPEEFNIIFMDVQMPLMDGYEAARNIRALGSAWALKVPMIAVTANVFSDDIHKCQTAGMNGHIGKPLNFD